MPKVGAEQSERSLQCDCLQYKWNLFVSAAIQDYMEKLVIRNKF